MTPKFNSAARVHLILQEASQQNAQIHTVDAWARVFEIPSNIGSRRSILVTEMVGNLYSEVEIVHAQMKATDLTPSLYEDVFAKAYASLDLHSLTSNWSNYNTHLNEKTLSMFALFSELLEGEGDPINQADLVHLAKDLDGLEDEIINGMLPPEVKAFLLRQIKLLREAIRVYRVVGKKAFTVAFMSATSEVALNYGTINESSKSEEFQQVWSKIQSFWLFIKDRTDDIEKLLVIYGGYKALETGIQSAIQLIGPLTGGHY